MDVSTPRIAVTLTKTMAREKGVSARFTGADRVRDLTRYLGEHGVVRTHKTLSEPAGGFTIAFPDQPDSAAQDSLYGLIEPMDVVEIRMGRDPGVLPIIMRGFVVQVSRSEQMTPAGPMRTVLVQGHDYGALLRWIGVNWRYAVTHNPDDPSPFFTPFKLQSVLGMDGDIPTDVPAGEFVTQIVEQAVNPWLDTLAARSKDKAILALGVDATVTDGTIGSQSAGAHEGDLWSLLAAVCDLDWNELFIEEREEQPFLVYRPRPWKDSANDGALIMPGAADPGTVAVTALEVRDIQLSHSSTAVTNWVWVKYFGDWMSPVTASAQAVFDGRCEITPEISPNSDKTLFGMRPLERTTAQRPAEAPTDREGDYAVRAEADGAVLDWRTLRKDQLIAMHKDNIVYEDGAMTLRGRPDVVAGKYIDLTRGSFTGSYYVTAVSQMFSPFQDWTTQLEVARGTGFLERMKQAGAPIWMEGRPGAY